MNKTTPNKAKQILSEIAGNPWAGLQKADEQWSAYRSGPREVLPVISQQDEPLESVTYDVAICGGTLGILLGAALVGLGWKVALLERGELRGRDQEWNISRRELDTFVQMGLLSEEGLEEAIASQYNPARVAFNGGPDLWVEDVLNIGVDPVSLLEQLKQKFLAQGGTLLENTPFHAATVHPNGVKIETSKEQAGKEQTSKEQTSKEQTNNGSITARLLVDAMGHFSP
ncbi:MAG: hypothetical protein WA984_12020, partial [Phormidesmis sp.]